MIQNGYTALLYATEKEQLDAMKILLQADAEVDAQNKVNNIPVHHKLYG